MLKWYYQPQEWLSKGETIMIYQRETIKDKFDYVGYDIAEVVTRLPQENETIKIDPLNPQLEIKVDYIEKIKCECIFEKSRGYDYYYVEYFLGDKLLCCVLAKAVENE